MIKVYSKPYKALKRHDSIRAFMVEIVASKLRLNRINTWTVYYALRRLLECKRAEELGAVLTRLHLLGFPALEYLSDQYGIDADTMLYDIKQNLHTPSELFNELIDHLEKNVDKLCPYQQPVA